MRKIKAIFIVGPTASGKTALSVELAKRFGFEIVCADSMQIYSELSISTARPTIDEMCGILHHLFGTVSVKREYSVADYCYEAGNMIKNLHQKGNGEKGSKNPFVKSFGRAFPFQKL